MSKMKSLNKPLFGVGISLLVLLLPIWSGRAVKASEPDAELEPAARASITIDLSKNQQDVIIRGNRSNAYLGEVTGSADFNGDGLDDLLIGAGGHDYHGQFTGAAYMILGKRNLDATVDLKNTAANLTVYGERMNEALGHSVASGDINNDGIDDMIIAADAYDTDRGAVYVVLGGRNMYDSPVVLDLANPASKAWLKITGYAQGDRFGRSIASGDINNDGYDDIIIGAYTASPNGRIQAGAVYVVLGGSYSHGTVINLNSQPAALTIFGASGDPDGFRQNHLDGEIDLVPFFADELNLPLNGEIGDRLGRSVAVGDVNNDGIKDLILGAYGANANGKVDTGKTYVFYGSQSYSNASPITVDLSANPAAANHTFLGVDSGDQSGFYVGSGDVNRDGFADVLIGAYFSRGYQNNAGAETGEVYVVFGSQSLPGTIDLAAGANLTIYGAAAGDRLGRSLAAGDVNMDGYFDLILGASRADPDGRLDAGIVYVIYGASHPAGTIRLSDPNSAGMRILGATGGSSICTDTVDDTSSDCADELGHSATVGDINGDGFKDIIAGALFANNGSTQDAGAVYIITGKPEADRSNRIYLPIMRR